MGNFYKGTFSRFDTIPECDRHTHRQTDTRRRHIPRLARRRAVKTAKGRITQIMPHDRPSFQMGCFVVAEFPLTCASRGPSAIAEPLVTTNIEYDYSMKGRQLDVVMTEMDLGAIISSNLKVTEQCYDAYHKANKMLGLLKRTVK